MRFLSVSSENCLAFYLSENDCHLHSIKKGNKNTLFFLLDCAFVQLERWAQCEDAINKLNAKKSFDGQKPIVVKFANFHGKEREDRGYSGGGGGGRRGGYSRGQDDDY